MQSLRFRPITFVDQGLCIAPADLGLLDRIAATPCLIEPFRQQPPVIEVCNCKAKLFAVFAELQRQADREKRKGRTQQAAIAAILGLPSEDPRRLSVLQLLATWKVSLEVTGLTEQEDETMVQLSQAYLEWEQRTKQQGIEQGIEVPILMVLSCRLLGGETFQRVVKLSDF